MPVVYGRATTRPSFLHRQILAGPLGSPPGSPYPRNGRTGVLLPRGALPPKRRRPIKDAPRNSPHFGKRNMPVAPQSGELLTFPRNLATAGFEPKLASSAKQRGVRGVVERTFPWPIFSRVHIENPPTPSASPAASNWSQKTDFTRITFVRPR